VKRLQKGDIMVYIQPNPPSPFPAREGGRDTALLLGEGTGVKWTGANPTPRPPSLQGKGEHTPLSF